MIRPLAWLGAGMRVLAFPVALLWPAGTWRWWEAWAVIGVWIVFLAALTVLLVRHDPALLAERMRASPVQEDQKAWDKVLMLAILPVGIALYIVPGFDVVRFGWSEPLPVWLEVLALVMHAPGFVLIAWVARENTYLSRVVKIERDHHVITTGPYAFVRHPMYSGVIALVFAFAVALGSRFALIPAAIVAGLMVVRTYYEDHALHAELPGYPEYAERTRYRLMPGIW